MIIDTTIGSEPISQMYAPLCPEMKEARNSGDRPNEVEILRLAAGSAAPTRRLERLRFILGCGDERQWYPKVPPTTFSNESQIRVGPGAPEVGRHVLCVFHGLQTVVEEL